MKAKKPKAEKKAKTKALRVALVAHTIDPALVFAWLSITGVLFIFYILLTWISDSICKQKIQAQDDEKVLKEMNLTKHLSFFWAGYLEEERLLLHIFGLLTVALILLYHPVLSFIAPKVRLLWLIIIHVSFTAITIAAYVKVSTTNLYLHQIKNFIDKDYCDTLDQTTYIRERAAFYAKVANDIYADHLREAINQNAAPQVSSSTTTT